MQLIKIYHLQMDQKMYFINYYILQWFKLYGRPSDPDDPGMYSSFKQSDRVYGQTHIHKAFRSTATKLVRGRCTQ